jgi:hypothetical protein
MKIIFRGLFEIVTGEAAAKAGVCISRKLSGGMALHLTAAFLYLAG